MRSNYNIITMKKLVYLLAVGSLAFTACNNSPAYKVSGTVEGLADGDTIYLQEYKNGDWVKLDSTTVAGGTFTFTGRQDTALSSMQKTENVTVPISSSKTEISLLHWAKKTKSAVLQTMILISSSKITSSL